ncbi:DnaD domain protein [Lactonifactor longoviformis]|uniref:DnaD and phage-associated domain-containing protein n=1 Tax=Lactonifactor longoviformis DSM 17459 TaxID=1122155 RepID=A0A1M5C2R0_9CLOT|nr:DnaD domain protein [Lactonifactor longoviformis]POP32252.1 DnaD domain protein [Lactonifactor longoviformis]SHF48971.1 DnaD and phage-associated domain-containing protein [Lactonifactor longoviformis DSM 17459]
MRQITIHNRSALETTVISNIFLDDYMPQANGEFVKIYLHLLRAAAVPDASITLSSIADTFTCTEKDVIRALNYWKKAGILDITLDEQKNLTGIVFLPLQRQAAASEPLAVREDITAPVAATTERVPAEKIPKKAKLTSDREKKLKENDEIKQLLFIAEQYLGKTLSQTDVSRILYFYDELHFSADLIEYLIEYCVSKGSASMHYIEAVALAWAKNDITTVAMAKKESSSYHKDYYTILKAFGIKGRNPIEAEIRYMDLWIKDYGFTLDIISQACQRTVLQTNQASFPYADSILARWKRQGVHHVSDIEVLDTRHQQAKADKAALPPQASTRKPASGNVSKNKFNNFHQRDYDEDELSALERQLLNQ